MRGAIAAGHPCSTAAGAELLAAGGNAVDACLAAVFAAFVAEGPLTGPAGGGFLLVCEPGSEPVVVDCFFAAPLRARGAMEELEIDFADASTQIFHVGQESVAVPGLLQGLEHAHDRFGRLAWPALLEPALTLAREGVPINEAQAFLLDILVPILQREEGGAAIYAARDRLDTRSMVPALEWIRDDRSNAAARLVPELATDLGLYRVVERAPCRASIDGLDVYAAPEPSIGGAIVLDALRGLSSARDVDGWARAMAAAYGRAFGGRVTGTTHVSVVDDELRVAALSSTLGSGSGVFRQGFQLNNMLGELDVIGDEPSSPGERLASMMTPTLVLREGLPRLVLGSAGSVRLAGAIAQVARRVVGERLTVGAAIDAPRLHTDGTVLHLEGGWDESALTGLDPAWEQVRWSGRNLFFGGVSAVERRPDGSFAAAGDPRRGGLGLVVS
jgi:gamma-glutamyltranspeptidase/glutathione hydrolase